MRYWVRYLDGKPWRVYREDEARCETYLPAERCWVAYGRSVEGAYWADIGGGDGLDWVEVDEDEANSVIASFASSVD